LRQLSRTRSDFEDAHACRRVVKRELGDAASRARIHEKVLPEPFFRPVAELFQERARMVHARRLRVI
jgi:hypothetical protein